MLHTHTMKDSDPSFAIDLFTREVTNTESEKRILMQYDHNSEIFTFELDRHIEGHDMGLCNRVEIHYTNGSSRQKSEGIYEVKDYDSKPTDKSKMVFSWTVSGDATLYPGPLEFLIEFACVEEGEVVYSWHTNINDDITIVEGMDNSEVVADYLPDILEQWKEELFSVNYAYQAALNNGFVGTEAEWVESLQGEDAPSAYDIAVNNGFKGSEADWLITLHGDSMPGIVVSDTEPSVFPYFWFDTSVEPNTSTVLVSSDEKAELFAKVEDSVYSYSNADVEVSSDDSVIVTV